MRVGVWGGVAARLCSDGQADRMMHTLRQFPARFSGMHYRDRSLRSAAVLVRYSEMCD